MLNFSAYKHIQSDTYSISQVLEQLEFSQIIKHDSSKKYCSYQKVIKSINPYHFPQLWVDSHYFLFQQYCIQFLDQLYNSDNWKNQTLNQLDYTVEDFMFLRSNNREKMIGCLEPIFLVKSKCYADIELNIKLVLFNLYWDREKENKITNFMKSIWHLTNRYIIISTKRIKHRVFGNLL